MCWVSPHSRYAALVSPAHRNAALVGQNIPDQSGKHDDLVSHNIDGNHPTQYAARYLKEARHSQNVSHQGCMRHHTQTAPKEKRINPSFGQEEGDTTEHQRDDDTQEKHHRTNASDRFHGDVRCPQRPNERVQTASEREALGQREQEPLGRAPNTRAMERRLS